MVVVSQIARGLQVLLGVAQLGPSNGAPSHAQERLLGSPSTPSTWRPTLSSHAMSPRSLCPGVVAWSLILRWCSAHLLLVWAFQLTAIDLDGDPLTYSISGPDSFYFSVDAQTGSVTLRNSLDREARLTITVGVFDGTNDAVSRKLAIIVEDRNDNAPVFQHLPYETFIPENTKPGSSIYTVFANDIDTGNASKVSYSIEEVIPDNTKNHWLFYILANGNVVLNGSLDYAKNTFYQLKILAKDGGGMLHNMLTFQNSSTYLSVTILDQPNLDPRFLNEPYSSSVPENCAGTTVLTVTAMDRDTGVNDEISYSITSSKGNPILFLSPGPSDQLSPPAQAREMHLDIHGKVALARTLVAVTVTDVNDNKPQFYHCSLPSCNFSTSAQNNFRGNIIEHSSSRLPVSNLSIVAHDPDKVGTINSNYELYLQGPNASAFAVSPAKIVGTGEVQLLVQDPSSVDYEISHIMVVQVGPVGLAHCGGIPCSLHMLGHSRDTALLLQSSKAYDPDSGVLGQITYQLLPESIRKIFMVNATTGAVLVQNGSLLDRETRSIYYANLQAKDGGNLVGTTVLEITVLDYNDMAPIITGSYFISVEEGLNIRTQIQAIDNDEPGNLNSKLGFKILPGPFSNNFTINASTGEMRSKEPLDREALEDEQGQMVVTVKVYDHGTPPLSTLVNVTITVGVSRSCTTRFSLVGVVEATDADQTDINSRISFLLQRGSGSSNFLIRSSHLGPGHYGGQLSVDPDISLDYDTLKQKLFSLVVLAENTAAENMGDTANVSVVVHILDINDEPPTVQPVSLKDVHVSENGTQQGLVHTLLASDPDTNHSLVFEELSVTCFKGASSAGEVCWDWFMLAPNGSVLVNSSDIDYELCDRVVLTLRAEDLYTERGNRYSQNETLRILITDVNDNTPFFLPIMETFGEKPGLVGLSHPCSCHALSLQATDADSGLKGTIIFSIVSVVLVDDNGVSRPFENLFKVVTTPEQDSYVGSIQVASNLDGSLKGQYQVTVEAQDREAPVHTAQTVLNIFAVDQSYRIRLQFMTTVDEVQSNAENIKVVKAKSVMEAYFVYSNGTALDVNQLSVCVLGRGPRMGTATCLDRPHHSCLRFPRQAHTVQPAGPG
uniref:Cadherin related family member 2 n=1 Tax=Accipiter nisus TaxID=211598 RepID=A0A8B9NC95_9AVES